ncbi:hypothetical protein [Paralcaligenes ureilyticus]|uniref:Uncharacterized protein n=1 Tax=Paralcaligenes ureilyticus TaxID=627131 RepID=A0A4R3MAG1_9BURK|nr:hypothetical protein [Paralcaligenes ureilyticus]TCT10122.1 hypothetical protein EDC26_10278 [Paralcaligenes ureilyticus]
MANINESPTDKDLPNGAGAAAILAAGIGCAALGILALLGDAFSTIKNLLNFYNPTGPLSGVTTVAIVVWLASWFILARKWDGRDVALNRVGVIAFILLALGLFLTFPPGMDLLQGK